MAKDQKSNAVKIKEIQFMQGQLAEAIASLGNNMQATAQIIGQYVAATDVLVQKGIITKDEIDARLRQLQEEATAQMKADTKVQEISSEVEKVIAEVEAEVEEDGREA